MKILDNGSVVSPVAREIILNGEDLQKLVSSGALQAGPVLLKFERAAGESYSFGRSRSESRSEGTSGSSSSSSENWSSGKGWSSTTGTSGSDNSRG
jgi:hypothetical protein